MRGEGYEEVRGGVRKHLKSRNGNSLNSPPNLAPSSRPRTKRLRLAQHCVSPLTPVLLPSTPLTPGQSPPQRGSTPGRPPSRPTQHRSGPPPAVDTPPFGPDRPPSLPRAVPRGLSTPGRPYHVRGPQDDRPGADMATAAAPSAVEPIAAAPLESHGHHWE